MESGRVAGYDLGRISLFEMVWAMAALHFARTGVDVGVVEVGIGGRLSPTNILEPEVSVVTNVSLDHTGFLGPTEIDIAREKAQIIKTGNSATSAVTQTEVIDVIRERVTETGSKLWLVGQDVVFDVSGHDLGGESFQVTTPVRPYSDLTLGLLGVHQVVNAATAVSTIDLLNDRTFSIPASAVEAGLARARFPGRFEVVSESPLVVLDGARNVASAGVLADTVKDLFPGRRIVLLIGVLADKDARGIGDILAPLVQAAVVTEPPWEGRHGDPAELLAALSLFTPAQFEPDVGRALQLALDQTGSDDLLLVTGSLYLVGAVRHILRLSVTEE